MCLAILTMTILRVRACIHSEKEQELGGAKRCLQWRCLDWGSIGVTLYCTCSILFIHPPKHAKIPAHFPIHISLVTTSCLCVPLPLGNNHGFEVLTLGHLGLDVGDDVGKIRCVLDCISKSTLCSLWCPHLIRLGPLLLWQKLVGHG
jgi:hypothetical protein